MSNQPFFIDTFREFLDQYNRKEISISKLVEDLNTVAHSWATDSEKKATWTVRDIDLITDYADFDEKAKIKMIEDRIQKFWKDNPSLLPTQPADVQERAKDDYLKSLSSSIAHFKSVNKGEFAAGILLAYNRYKDTYLAGASSGMQWVKASNRLPEANEDIPIKVTNDIGVIKYDTASLNPFTQVFCGRLYTYDKKYVEWLDESSPSSMQEENERLRKALTKIIDLYPSDDRDGRPIIALNDIRQTAFDALKP